MRDWLFLAAGALISALVWPSEWVPSGLAVLGPLILVPVFWFTARHSPGASAMAGALWISLLTVASQPWLLQFHPLAFPLVLLFQIPWYVLAFAGSSLLHRRLRTGGPWFQALWWVFIEFLKVQGFFAYPYLSLASTVWTWPVAFQTADLAGTSLITFLLAGTSGWVASLLDPRISARRRYADLALGVALWSGNLAYGAWRWLEPVPGPKWRPALVQQSQDPWKGGADAYEASFEVLARLSTQALGERPDAVIWSETAFVPSVEYHSRYHENADSLRLVRRLEAFLEAQTVPFLVGNDHRQKASSGNIEDYNSVLAWDQGWKGRYDKVRLVPFTESFPYKDVLPAVYQWLLDADTHFWYPGTQWNLLSLGGVAVGTPICYEDAFADGARQFSLAGARALVNLTNDSWAPGTASRMQHLALAVFRSVETRLPLVRAGNDGATASVSSRGEVLALLPVGPAGVLQADVDLGSGFPTAYTTFGDWFPWISALVVAGGLLYPRRSRSVVDKGD